MINTTYTDTVLLALILLVLMAQFRWERKIWEKWMQDEQEDRDK